jgi:CspA family cold shock protein
MTIGTVKWFNDAKGFGFIEPEGGGEDVFAHFSAIQMVGFRTLKQGEKVEFELTQGPKGQLAQNIRSVAPAPEEVVAATPSTPMGSGLDLDAVPLAPAPLVVAAAVAAAAAGQMGSASASAG